MKLKINIETDEQFIFLGVTTHDGQFYVSDTGNDRVQVFDKDGKFVQCIGKL